MLGSSYRPNAKASDGQIRIMIVDDHARVRHGLGIFLSTCPGLTVVAEAGTGAEALAKFPAASPAVVVIDLAAPGMDTAVISRRMKELAPNCQIIALAAYVDPDTERRVLEAGALCCLVKDSSAAELVEAIRRAHARICAGAAAASMTFVQEKTGDSADTESRVPSDGARGAAAYDGNAGSNGKGQATREVLIA